MKPLSGPGPRPGGADAEQLQRRPRRDHGPGRRRFSTLTLRVLAPNMLALGVLVAGIFYLDQYREGLLDAKVAALQTQAEIMAGAVGQAALAGPAENRHIDAVTAGVILQRLVQPTGVRARLYDRSGLLLSDSRELAAAGRQVQLRYLPPPGSGNQLIDLLNEFYDWLLPRLPRQDRFPAYRESPRQGIDGFPEAKTALTGNVGGAVRVMPDGTLIATVAVPVKELRQVVGALMVSTDSRDIEEGVRTARVAILQAFAIALAVTVLLSMFLAGTIARPVRRLASAADKVRRWRGRRVEIPDLSRRGDEIGDLSEALREMTGALYARLDAIDVFAADVAHEIKNPITSIRSALEAFERTSDPAQRARLHQVMLQDVHRLDRLISDISNASRIDAEMSRTAAEPVDLVELLRTATQIHQDRGNADAPVLSLSLPSSGSFVVDGLAGRLGQVVDNLIANATSFSKPGGKIRLGLSRDNGRAVLTVEDDGPGIPPGREERIFERFYSERPNERRTRGHSGLGLSICRQIVEAHGGEIRAENRLDDGKRVLGARFVVTLPLN